MNAEGLDSKHDHSRTDSQSLPDNRRVVFWAWLSIAFGVIFSLALAGALIWASQSYNRQAQMLPSRANSKFPPPVWVPPRSEGGAQ